MSRRRPRVGQSVVDRTTWGPFGAPPPGLSPPDQFTLVFNNVVVPRVDVNAFDYTYDPGGGAPQRSLLDLDLIVAADGLLPPSVDGWAGLAQPLEIQCRHRAGAADRLPPDFECRFTHRHQRWERVDERGDNGDFRGVVRGPHEHVFRMDEWVLAEIEVTPGRPGQPPVLGVSWFAAHAH
jgi:hypothetical protein